jgi:hypothetical protein
VFSLFPSRSLVVPGIGAGGVPLVAPWWRVVVGSGLSCGAVRWRVRSSLAAFSGAVVVVGFSSRSAAVSFAGAWSGTVGFPCAVRHFSGGVWGVSVPVAAPPSPAVVAPVPVLPPVAVWVS